MSGCSDNWVLRHGSSQGEAKSRSTHVIGAWMTKEMVTYQFWTGWGLGRDDKLGLRCCQVEMSSRQTYRLEAKKKIYRSLWYTDNS